MAATLVVAGCDAFNSKKERLPGQRISVLELEKQLEPDPGLASLEIALPHPATNKDWPQSGGLASHDMIHPALPDPLTMAWNVTVGAGASRYAEMLATPVIVDGVIYAMDSTSLVTAYRTTDGQKLWEFDVTPKDSENQGWGGGIAYSDGHIFISTGFAQVIAIDAKDGHEAWRVPMTSPMRSAPTVDDGRVFVITVDNELVALDAKDGHRLWNYDGIPEAAELAGSGSPAVSGEVVVAPFSSGEIVALRVENGRVIWNDSLAATRRFDPMSTLADVRGRPVIDRGRVYAISHSGRMTAIDLRTGDRIWEQEIGGTFAPWVAGDFVYVLSTSAELICLTRNDGRIRWITQLNAHEDATDDKSDPVQWAGPILAGDRLIVVGSIGEAWSVSPYTGKVLGHLPLPAESFLAPAVADGTLYLTTDDASLMALR